MRLYTALAGGWRTTCSEKGDRLLLLLPLAESEARPYTLLRLREVLWGGRDVCMYVCMYETHNLVNVSGEGIDKTLFKSGSADGEEVGTLEDMGAEERSGSASLAVTKELVEQQSCFKATVPRAEGFPEGFAEKKDGIKSVGTDEDREGEPTSESGDSESGEADALGMGKGAEAGTLERLKSIGVGAEEERCKEELSVGEEGGEEDGDRLLRLRREISTSFRDRFNGTASKGSRLSPRA